MTYKSLDLSSISKQLTWIMDLKHLIRVIENNQKDKAGLFEPILCKKYP